MGGKQGFTIVELLVVLVVIAILATVAIVSYVSVQDRARNAQIIDTVGAWTKTFRMYEGSKGNYPDGPYEYVCLGSGFAALSPYAAGQCKAGTWTVADNATFMGQLATATGADAPTAPFPSFTLGTESYRAPLYLTRNGGHGITYVIKGSTSDCTIGAGWYSNSGYTVCRIVFDGDPYNGL